MTYEAKKLLLIAVYLAAISSALIALNLSCSEETVDAVCRDGSLRIVQDGYEILTDRKCEVRE
jgi:hypothetical protein